MDDEWVKNTLINIDSKVDKLDMRLDNVDVTLGKQQVELSDHIRRTEIAEQNITLIRSEIKPIQKHVDMIHGALKLLGLVTSIVGLIAGVIKIMEFIR